MNLATTPPATSPQERGVNMTIYSKTNAGRLLAFEQKPSVSLALRDLLRRVDGKTSSAQLITQPGDAELFEELCVRQLVRVATEPWRNSAHPTPSVSPSVSAADDHGPRLSLVSKLDSPKADTKIDAVKALMSEFIQVRMPEHVNGTLGEIDALQSETQLLCMLSGYINLINSTGLTGQRHVQELLLILTRAE